MDPNIRHIEAERCKEYYTNNKEKENERSRKYHDAHKEDINGKHKAYNKEHKSELKQYMGKYSRDLKILALKAIANFHNSEVKCWRCGENRLWVLTIGHINQDGKDERNRKKGSGLSFYRSIIKGERIPTDLKIECINCNCCLQWYGRYPDEINEEEFRNGD